MVNRLQIIPVRPLSAEKWKRIISNPDDGGDVEGRETWPQKWTSTLFLVSQSETLDLVFMKRSKSEFQLDSP